MANLTITAANLGVSSAIGQATPVQVSEAVDHGEIIRNDGGKYALCDSSTADDAAAEMIAFSSADADGWVLAVALADVDFGAILTKGEVYVVSATAGKIAPIGDVTTGFQKILGVAKSTSVLQFRPSQYPVIDL